MEKTNFVNDAAKYGAIVGALLCVSIAAETTLAMNLTLTLGLVWIFEWVIVVALHYFLLHYFTRQRSRLYSAEEGFTFGQGYGYVLAISGFAGILGGVAQAVILHYLVGYSVYIERFIASMGALFQESAVSGEVQAAFANAFDQMQNTAAPSILSSVFGGILSSLLFGAVFGLIIAGVLSRAPKPFEVESNE